MSIIHCRLVKVLFLNALLFYYLLKHKLSLGALLLIVVEFEKQVTLYYRLYY